MLRETSPAALLGQPPMIGLRPERSNCTCAGELLVLKTRRKTVLSLAGPFVARETLLHCPACSTVYGSAELLTIVPSRCTVAYDVLVFVGRALFQRHRTEQEVLEELAPLNLDLSPAGIGYLGRKFILLLALAHRRAGPRLRKAMRLAGGYVLHLDAMHAGNAPTLMTGLDSLSDLILANVKVPSENTDDIVPFLEEIVEQYGPPTACVHDMGKGISKAVATVLKGVPDFICHFHFLRDLGNDFLGPAYDRLRKRLRRHALSGALCALARQLAHRLTGARPKRLARAIGAVDAGVDPERLPAACAYALTKWVLEGKKTGGGYGLPFDRPNLSFAQRMLQLHEALPGFKDQFISGDWRDNKPVYDLVRLLAKAADDRQLRRAVDELRWRTALFDQLRVAMRIAPKDGTGGLNSGDDPVAMPAIRRAVTRFRAKLDTDPKLLADTLSGHMAAQIDTYAEKLFADPIAVQTPNGPVLIQPQRTNNIMERVFRDLSRGHRRRTGTGAMDRTMRAMLADTPLVRNLDNPAYMDILLDGKKNLEQVFAQISPDELREQTARQSDPDRMLPGFRSLVRMPSLPQLVAAVFSRSRGAQSN